MNSPWVVLYTLYTALFIRDHVLCIAFFLAIKYLELHYVEAFLFFPHVPVNRETIFLWNQTCPVPVDQEGHPGPAEALPCLHHSTHLPLVAQSSIDSMLMAVESNSSGKRIPSTC